jgi:hypothetical protein
MKKILIREPIAQWLVKLLANNLISTELYNEVIHDNENKSGKLISWQLPHEPVFGPFSSIECSKQGLPSNLFDTNLVVRFIPTTLNPNHFKKFIKVTFGELPLLTNELPLPINNYTITFRKFIEAKYIGWLMINEGKVLSELSPEPNETGEAKYNCTRLIGNFNTGQQHFTYENADDIEKQIMLNAIRYFCRNMLRSEIIETRIYTEYMFTDDNNYVFLDVSDHPFWLL